MRHEPRFKFHGLPVFVFDKALHLTDDHVYVGRYNGVITDSYNLFSRNPLDEETVRTALHAYDQGMLAELKEDV